MADQGPLAPALAAISAHVPSPIGERIDRAVDAVARSDAATGLAVGDRAPEFTLPDALGNHVTLADRLSTGPAVLVFYRGEWCPYCNTYLRALQAILPDLRTRGASLIAISPQTPDHALSMTEKADFEFDVLSDATQHVIRDYHVQFEVVGDLRAIHLDAFKLDVRRQNADDSWNLPVPATFVINEDGTIVAAHVDADYRRRMEPRDILAALDASAAG